MSRKSPSASDGQQQGTPITDPNSSQDNWPVTLTRHATTQAFNIAIAAAREEQLRRDVLERFNITKEILRDVQARSPYAFSKALLETEKEIFFALHDTGDIALLQLRDKSTPVGKSALPKMVNMY